MSRLTKEVREQMARKLVAYRYTDEAKAIVQDGKKLFERVYDHCYPKPVVEALLVLAKHFPGSLSAGDNLDVNANGYSVTVGGRFYSRWVSVPQVKENTKPVFGRRHSISDEKLAKEVQGYAQRKYDFEDVCKTAYHEAMSVLNTMTTGKKLAEAWPEAMEVIGDLIPEGSRTLPVVQVSAVNAKFGLPPKKAVG